MLDFPLTSRFLTALQFAHAWHTGQYRKVGEGETETVPYISHLLGVAAVALEFGAGEDEAIAALLHDALEDGPGNLEPHEKKRADKAEELRTTIRSTFGEVVEALVVGATEDTPLVDGRKAPWEARKAHYLARLVDHSHPEPAASLLVSASDKLHNARSILEGVFTGGDAPAARDAFFSRFKQGRDGTLQYYRLLVDAYRAAPGIQGQVRLGQLIDELDRTVTALEQACGMTAQDTRGYPLLGASADLIRAAGADGAGFRS